MLKQINPRPTRPHKALIAHKAARRVDKQLEASAMIPRIYVALLSSWAADFNVRFSG